MTDTFPDQHPLVNHLFNNATSGAASPCRVMTSKGYSRTFVWSDSADMGRRMVLQREAGR
jgi:hypothetical protein